MSAAETVVTVQRRSSLCNLLTGAFVSKLDNNALAEWMGNHSVDPEFLLKLIKRKLSPGQTQSAGMVLDAALENRNISAVLYLRKLGVGLPELSAAGMKPENYVLDGGASGYILPLVTASPEELESDGFQQDLLKCMKMEAAVLRRMLSEGGQKEAAFCAHACAVAGSFGFDPNFFTSKEGTRQYQKECREATRQLEEAGFHHDLAYFAAPPPGTSIDLSYVERIDERVTEILEKVFQQVTPEKHPALTAAKTQIGEKIIAAARKWAYASAAVFRKPSPEGLERLNKAVTGLDHAIRYFEAPLREQREIEESYVQS